MKGEDIDAYIVKIEELIRLAEYRFDVPQTIEVFTDGLPTGLYQKILELDRPATYEQSLWAFYDVKSIFMLIL